MNNHWKKTGAIAIAVIAVAALTGSAAAFAGEHGHGFGGWMAQQRFEKILDELNATPEQRQKLAPVEAKLVEDLKAAGEKHRALMKELKNQIGQDTVNLESFDRLAADQKQAAEQLHDDIRAAIQQVHDTLSPTQRAQFSQLKMGHNFERQTEPVQ